MPSKKQRRARKLRANSHNEGFSGNSRGSIFGYHLTGTYHNSNTNVDYWDSAGYPKLLNFGDHWNIQSRFGIAHAGIHKIVDKCWQSNPIITDGKNDGKRDSTPFEQDLNILIEKHALFARLKGVDWRQRVGRYAVILPIIKEQSPGETFEPIKKVNSIEALIKLVPKFESQVDVTDVGTNTDINSEDYGMPSHYNLREEVFGDRNPIDNKQVKLDPSRVFAVAEGADDGGIFGIPANEAGFNALIDLEIICASGQTALRKNAKQRFITSIKDNQVASALKDEKLKKEYDQNVDNFNRGDAPNLTVYGMDIHTLQSTLADPTAPFTNSLNVYAASVNTPASEIIGVQMNKQASAGNEMAFNETATSRRENFITPAIIIAFLNYLINIGVVNEPSEEIIVTWLPLQEDSPSQMLELTDKMANINEKAWKTGRGEPIFSDIEMRLAAGHEAEKPDDLEEFTDDEDDDDDDNNKDDINVKD